MSDKQRIAELEKELEEARILAAQYQGRIIDKERDCICPEPHDGWC